MTVDESTHDKRDLNTILVGLAALGVPGIRVDPGPGHGAHLLQDTEGRPIVQGGELDDVALCFLLRMLRAQGFGYALESSLALPGVHMATVNWPTRESPGTWGADHAWGESPAIALALAVEETWKKRGGP